jgi:hypothetical protein
LSILGKNSTDELHVFLYLFFLLFVCFLVFAESLHYELQFFSEVPM